MIVKLLSRPSRFPRLREPSRLITEVMNLPSSATKYKKLNNNDLFIKEKVPVQKCAGIFCVSTKFKEAIKNVDIYALNIGINRKNKTVNIKNQPELTKAINEYMEKVPEFFSVFVPKVVDDDPIDRHSLSVFQQIVSHPEYEKISPKKQAICDFLALNHDLGKTLDLSNNHPEATLKLITKRVKSLFPDKTDQNLFFKQPLK